MISSGLWSTQITSNIIESKFEKECCFLEEKEDWSLKDIYFGNSV